MSSFSPWSFFLSIIFRALGYPCSSSTRKTSPKASLPNSLFLIYLSRNLVPVGLVLFISCSILFEKPRLILNLTRCAPVPWRKKKCAKVWVPLLELGLILQAAFCWFGSSLKKGMNSVYVVYYEVYLFEKSMNISIRLYFESHKDFQVSPCPFDASWLTRLSAI